MLEDKFRKKDRALESLNKDLEKYKMGTHTGPYVRASMTEKKT